MVANSFEREAEKIIESGEKQEDERNFLPGSLATLLQIIFFFPNFSEHRITSKKNSSTFSDCVKETVLLKTTHTPNNKKNHQSCGDRFIPQILHKY